MPVRWNVLEALAAERGLQLPPEALSQLQRYLDELHRWRSAVNLTGPSSPQRLADDLLADAVPLATALRPLDVVLDLGAGAGLLGLVLAVLRPDVRVDLWEPRQRRAAFLRAAVQLLDLRSAQVHEQRAPEAGPLAYDVLSARAVWPPAEWLTRAARLARPGARVVLHTTVAAGVPASPPALRSLQTIDYNLGSPRRLVVFERRSDG